MTRRGAADLLAGVAAFAVLVAGLAFVIGDSHVLAPESKTTVTKQAVPATAGTTKTTTTTSRPGGAKRGQRAATTTAVETTGAAPAKPAETTTTVESGERTFAERVLGDGGLIVLQIAAVLLAAFLAAAAVQRLILGQFGFKFGTFELADVADVSADGINTLDAKIETVKAALAALDDKRRDDTAGIKDDLAIAYKKIALIEDEVKAKLSGGGT